MSLWRRRQQGPRRGPTVAVAAVVGVVMLATMVTGLVHDETGSDSIRSPAPPISGEPTSTSATAWPQGSHSSDVVGGKVARLGATVALPIGTGEVDGYPVGFPHTGLGAAAAVVGFDRAQIGFDYDRAAAIAGVYAAPADVAALQARARTAVASRRHLLGVPATRAPAAPAAFALTPFAFTLDELTADSYVVTVLNLATTTHTNSWVRNLYYSGTQVVRWVSDDSTADDLDGDWKVVDPSPGGLRRIAVLPHLPAIGPRDPRFVDSGWTAITPGGAQ